MMFLSPEIALYLCKSVIRPCMEYCCHVWAVSASCYLELLDKLQKWICMTLGPSLAASIEPLAHRRSVPRIICQQFLSSHSETLEFSAYRMLYFDV